MIIINRILKFEPETCAAFTHAGLTVRNRTENLYKSISVLSILRYYLIGVTISPKKIV